MADVDAALQWAQANPNHPQAQAVMAKAWALKNPNDPRSTQILSKLAGSVQQSQNPQQIPDAADKASQNNKPDAKPVSLMRGAAQQDISDLNAMPAGLKSGFAKVFAGLGAMGAGAALPAMGVAETAAANAGLAGSQKLIGNVADKNLNPLEGVGETAAMGGGMSLAASGISAAGSKLADWLQQRAMSVKGGKYIEGVGTEAINAGIRGSHDSMLEQVNDAIQGVGEHAGEEIGKLGRIDSSQAAQPLHDYASGMRVGEVLPAHSTGDYSGAIARVQDIASRGEVDPKDAWELAKKAGAAGYRNQKALQSEQAMLAQLEQQGYSNALKEAYSKANPGVPNQVAEDFSKMSNLYKSKQLLDVDPTIKSGLPLNVLAAAGLGAAAGGAADHSLSGAAKGAALGLALRNPSVQSYGAKGLSLLGQGAEMVADPAVLQGLFGAKNTLSPNQQ